MFCRFIESAKENWPQQKLKSPGQRRSLCLSVQQTLSRKNAQQKQIPQARLLPHWLQFRPRKRDLEILQSAFGMESLVILHKIANLRMPLLSWSQTTWENVGISLYSSISTGSTALQSPITIYFHSDLYFSWYCYAQNLGNNWLQFNIEPDFAVSCMGEWDFGQWQSLFRLENLGWEPISNISESSCQLSGHRL